MSENKMLEPKDYERLDALNDELQVIRRAMEHPESCSPHTMDLLRMSVQYTHARYQELACEMRRSAISQPAAAYSAKQSEQETELAGWLQAVLTALNVGAIASESPLHKKIREVMIAYRQQKAPPKIAEVAP